jgi:ergosteryl-3beta-O-L-aspartate synthase
MQDVGKDQARGGPENDVQHELDMEDFSSSDDEEDDFTRSIDAKPLDDFLDSSDPPEIRRRYGRLDLIQSQPTKEHSAFANVPELTSHNLGQAIEFRARIHIIRRMSNALVFIVLREQLTTIQGVLRQRQGEVSESMVRWSEHLRTGSIVTVKGTLQRAEQAVKSTTFHDMEVLIQQIHLVSERVRPAPFNVYEAEAATDGHSLADHVRLSHRVLDLRTPTSQALFRLQSAVCNLFRTYLVEQGFLGTHTPKLQGGATEGGSDVFKVEYFGRTAFLAQSPQLAKQMCISADFRRVYEIGPVFRAENSNTARHMTEYTGLDLEMEINWHYHEAMWLIDSLLKYMFEGLYRDHRQEIETMKHHFPHEDLIWLEETPRLTFAEGVQLLNESGWRTEEGKEQSPLEDLSTRAEKALGAAVKEKYHTDYYILDKFPASARPFYTMLDPNEPQITNSFDFMVRGQEILSGGQRIHDVELLLKRMAESGVEPSSLREYVEAFGWVAPPHAGAGIGLERLLMLIFELGNIRYASLFPRDPRSFPADTTAPLLRHPEDDTTQRRKGYLPALANLVANYGDSTNTSWFDERYQIWRDPNTGAAVAYVPIHKRAILPGNPLCAAKQLPDVIGAFLAWLKAETNLKPIFLLVDKPVENVMGDHFGWKSFSNVAEQRVNLSNQQHLELEAEVQRKVRHAQKEGVKVNKYGHDVPEDVKKKCDEGISNWQKQRSGEQTHLSEITPWIDSAHRQYFIAESNGKVHAMVVLAQLAPRYGVQVKWAMEFPDAPSGVIEHTVQTALKAAAETNKTCTFGAGVLSDLASGHNIGTAKATSLNTVYHAYADRFHVREKAGFREKFNTVNDPLYFCYPAKAMGRNGIRAIVDFFKD